MSADLGEQRTQRVLSMRPKKNGLLRVAFSRANGRPCPIRAQCTTSAPHLGRVLEIHPEPIHTARTRMQAEQDTPEWREAYGRHFDIRESTLVLHTRSLAGGGVPRYAVRSRTRVRHSPNLLPAAPSGPRASRAPVSEAPTAAGTLAVHARSPSTHRPTPAVSRLHPQPLPPAGRPRS
ncbi:transposase [Kitasatospora aureofaciens]|uniref:transposase n=1 Tax=Kitasatospora aureofaciens TaxID=1894 RepID=UPI0033B5FC9B